MQLIAPPMPTAHTVPAPAMAAGGSNRLRSFPRPDFLTLHCLLLLGYAVLGKLFAYIGFGGLYIGEIVLGIGVCGFLLSPSRWRILRNPHLWPLLALMLWGAIRTIPYVEAYGKNALRDAAVWGYGTFAILMAARIVAQPVSVSRLAERYATYIPIFLVAAPVIWLLSTVFEVITLVVRGQPSPILKGGDLLVHLSGVIAFVHLKVRKVPTAWLLLAPIAFVVGATNRGGLLSLGVAVTLLFLVHRKTHRLVLVAVAFATVFTAAMTFDIRFKPPNRYKELSPTAVAERIKSIFVDTSLVQYEATERWRLRWWRRIVQYTFLGPYFWSGKGFGPNVAYSDGMVVSSSDPLRSPHNGHLTFLSRSGVPGFVLWLVAQGCWMIGMFTSTRVQERSIWAGAEMGEPLVG